MKQLKIAKELASKKDIGINFEKLVSERTFICSMTRFGKSYTIRKICEEVFGKIGIIILDPEGEYCSLREHFPFLIIGQDIPLNPETADFLAEQVLKENLSVICDFSTSDIIDQQEFTAKFIDKFMDLQTKKKRSYLFLIEESDEVAPERGTFKSTSLRSVINLTKKGAKRGIGVILASQRPAFVSKFVLSQCVNQIIGHTEWTGDLKVIKDYLRISNETIDKIRILKAGEFYFKGSFITEPHFAKVNPATTTHLGATPELIPPTTKELRQIVSKLSFSLPKIVEQKLKPSIPDIKQIENKLRSKIESEYKFKVIKLERETKGLRKQQIPEEEIQERINKEIDEYKGKFQEQEIKIRNISKFISSLVVKANQILGEESQEIIRELTPSATPIESNYDIWLDKLTGGKKKILELLIKHRKLTQYQLVVMSGLKKSNIQTHLLPVLKKAGLIDYDKINVNLRN